MTEEALREIASLDYEDWVKENIDALIAEVRDLSAKLEFNEKGATLLQAQKTAADYRIEALEVERDNYRQLAAVWEEKWAASVAYCDTLIATKNRLAGQLARTLEVWNEWGPTDGDN